MFLTICEPAISTKCNKLISLQQIKMAESSAVTFLLKQLSTWLGEERELLGGLRDEAQIIRDTLEQMTAFLKHADSREEIDTELKVLVKQVREIAYEIEYVLESYMLLSERRFHGRLRKSFASLKNLKAKHKLASEIKILRSRLANVFNTFEKTRNFLPRSSTGAIDACFDGRGDARLLEEAEVVGIERPKKQLLDWISTGDYILKVVSVVGMAGLGKTTLVKKVYDDPLVKENIDPHAWITVSETFKVENILRDMINQLLDGVKQPPPPRLESMNADVMREFIYNFLQNKKYMIILDDIWSTDVWEALRYVFPRSGTQGRGCIIITTRFNNVGDIACCDIGGHVYHLKPLPSQKAEELFNKKVFRSGLCPDHLKEISGNILKRCDGLPLAIVLIGGVLATKRNDIAEWSKFNLGLEFNAEYDPLKRMWKLLSLSYYDLPYNLKICFLYLSIFPEDMPLEKNTIIRLWTAEGFVEVKQGRTMEEIAERYLNELSNRSLIEVATFSLDGRPINYGIHDLVREYIISKATTQNIVATKSQREKTWEDRIRRLALDDSFIGYSEKINNLKYLCTLLFSGSVDLKWGSIVCSVLHSCRMLKVLDLRGALLDTIPDEVFKLYHLRYLSLRKTNVSLIPKLIGNLIKLETLDLKGCRVIALPLEILKLQRLKYLLVYKYDPGGNYLKFDNTISFEAPDGIWQLLCLQKLCYINASANIVRAIGRLTELRRFGIVKLRKEDGKELCSSLEKLTHLSSIVISSLDEDEVIDLQYLKPDTCLHYLRSLVLYGCLEKLPQWIPSLKALTHLTLGWSRMAEDPLQYLQDLPNLQILVMSTFSYEGEGLNFKFGGFQKLTGLRLSGLRRLRWVRVENGSIPRLETLTMWDCKAMAEVPMGVEHLKSLNEVGFFDMSKEFKEKLVGEKTSESGPWKLTHVRRIYIGNWIEGEWRGEWL